MLPTGTRATGTEPPTRDKERTRLAVLEAAEALLIERGTGLSLADVAESAGVSKSGLLHHFKSKQELLLAVADHSLGRFHDEVMRHVDITENRAGKILRGYVRALCGDSALAMHVFAPSTQWGGIASIPGVDDLLRADADRWRDLFERDGLPADRSLVVRHAAEGVAAAADAPHYLDDREMAQVREALLRMAEPE